MILKRRDFENRKDFCHLTIVLSVSLIALYLSYTVVGETVIVDLFNFRTDDEDIFGSTYDNETFLVSSPNCQIPNLDPFHKSIRKFVSLGEPTVCSTRSPLTYITMASEGA
jgi:hypothetical protein